MSVVREGGKGVAAPVHAAVLLSPRDVALRWACSRTTAQRILDRAGVSRVNLGSGRNGLVRYPLDEVVAYERSRTHSREG